MIRWSTGTEPIHRHGRAVSGDPQYNGLNADDVSVTNRDNDTAHLTITPPTINGDECGSKP